MTIAHLAKDDPRQIKYIEEMNFVEFLDLSLYFKEKAAEQEIQRVHDEAERKARR